MQAECTPDPIEFLDNLRLCYLHLSPLFLGHLLYLSHAKNYAIYLDQR